MNTGAHTAVGATTALLTAKAIAVSPHPYLLGTGVVAALIASHLLMDMIPHLHLTNVVSLSERKCYFIEAFAGLLVIPLFIYFYTHAPLGWGIICCNAPNILDYTSFFGFGWSKRLGAWLDRWQQWSTMQDRIFAEVVTDLCVATTLICSVVWYAQHH